MSYLVQYALRRPPQQAVGQNRVDEKSLLNLPGFHGEAHVRVLVSDTTRQRWKREPPQPKIKLRITDCSHAIFLQFEVGSAEQRRNSLHKIDTLLDTLGLFRAALEAECELYEQRSRHARH